MAVSRDSQQHNGRRALQLCAAAATLVFAVEARAQGETPAAAAAPPPGEDRSDVAAAERVPAADAKASGGAADGGAAGSPTTAAPAPAGPEPERAAEAREVFKLGATLARQGQWSDALAAFERSAGLVDHPVTVYNIGYVERALGRYTLALTHLEESLAASEGTAARLPEDLEQQAKAYIAELQSRLARIEVTVDPGLAVAIDGRPLSAGPQTSVLVAGIAPSGPGAEPPARSFQLWIDPGSHVIVLNRVDGAQHVVRVQYATGAAETLTLAWPATAPSAPAAAPAPGSAADRNVTVRSSGITPRTWAYAAYGVGGAGVITGAVFGTMALLKHRSLEKDCPDKRCPHLSQQAEIDSMERDAMIADIGWIVAGVGAAAGTLVLLYAAESGEDAAADSARLVRGVEVGVGPGAVRVSGRF